VRIAVIGAGPAGLSVAAALKDAEVFEEHNVVGLPRHCTSLVSAVSAERVGIPREVVVRRYDELYVTNLDGDFIRFRIRGGVYLLDRPGLERRLAEHVANIRFGEKVTAIKGPYLYTERGEKYGPYDYIVVAEGSLRRLSRAYGEVVRLPGLQVDVKSPAELPGITVVYNPKISQAYFAWVVEVDKGVYRVGLADKCCLVEKLNKLVKLLKGSPVDRPFGGGVLAGPPVQRVVHGRVVLVGDAAGLVKPLSGGGIVLAVKSGKLAAEALARGTPSLYEEGTRQLRMRLRAAHLLFKLLYGKRAVDRLLKTLSGGDYLAVDYDDHVKTLATAALTDPRSLAALRALLLAGYSYVSHFFK